ncbi:MAG: MFS transporter [Pseudomonadota bacterium]
MTKSSAERLGTGTKLAYGFGSAAYGVKDGGFIYFLLLFYGQVVGLEPALVGLAILIALIFDAISDPIVGYISDNWRSRWGRRHPFMYAAAVPIGLVYFLIWNPPDWSDGALFWYLLATAILIRTFITFYETPSSALLPELTSQYHERTTLQSFRLFFGWFVGNAMTILMFGLLLRPNETYSDGVLNADGYATYGVIASVVIFLAIMVSALGTHGRIKHFNDPPPKQEFALSRAFQEIFETLFDKSFGALFIATLFGAVATGFSGALTFLIWSYFWEFTQDQIFIFTALVALSAIIGATIAPMITRVFGKKRAVIILGCVAFGAAPIPVVLRLFGLMPPAGDPWLFPIVAAVNTIDVALIIALQAVLYSMIADLVEESELKTGRRSEGVFYAAVTFTRKSNQGLGGFAAGVVLSLVAFPSNASPGTIDADTLWNLGAWYAVLLWMLWSAMIIAVCFYRIDQGTHEANLRELAIRKTQTGQ